jgi:cold-inducible RNA-binding protein
MQIRDGKRSAYYICYSRFDEGFRILGPFEWHSPEAQKAVDPVGNRLYVGNLSFNTTQDTLQAEFSAIGEVREVGMPIDRETGKPRGFAFVTMGSDQAASAAIQQLNGKNLDGRAIKVNEAEERPARSGGGGGGGYGGGRR